MRLITKAFRFEEMKFKIMGKDVKPVEKPNLFKKHTVKVISKFKQQTKSK